MLSPAALVMAVAPMAPNLSLRSSPAVTGSPTHPPLPQHLAAVAIDRAEVAIQAAVERQPAVGDQRTAPVRVRIRNLPDGLAGQRVVLLELAGDPRFLRIHEHVREHVHGTLLGV